MVDGQQHSQNQPVSSDYEWRPSQPQLIYNPAASQGVPDYIPSYYPSISPPYHMADSGHGGAGAFVPPGSPPYMHDAGTGIPGIFGHHNNQGYGNFGFYYSSPGGDYNQWGPSVISPAATGTQRGYEYHYDPMMGTGAAHYGPGSDMKQIECSIAQMNMNEHHGGIQQSLQSNALSHHHSMSGLTNAAIMIGGTNSGGGGSASGKKSWASIASQPAKKESAVQKRPKVPIGGVPSPVTACGNDQTVPPPWATKSIPPRQPLSSGGFGMSHWSGGETNNVGNGELGETENGGTADSGLRSTNSPGGKQSNTSSLDFQVNPKEFTLNTRNARYFVIKSYSEDDIHRSIKYHIWCSTEHGNKRLDNAFKERAGKGPIYLLFSVNGSGHFCGVAQMMSNVDYNVNSGVWAQDKWKGQFVVRWVYVKDVPNAQLRHIRLENNENKPVTNSRDTQEVPAEKGRQILLIVHKYRNQTSIFDDFQHYEKRQVDDESRKNRRGGGGSTGQNATTEHANASSGSD